MASLDHRGTTTYNLFPKQYRFVHKKYIPTPFWLYVIDIAIDWNLPTSAIMDDVEAVSVEWTKVEPLYNDLRRRMLVHFDRHHCAVFLANGKKPSLLGDDKAGRWDPSHTTTNTPVIPGQCRCFVVFLDTFK